MEAKAADIALSAPPSPPEVSPRWAHDRTLYWATSAGLFASTDLGESFALVAPQVTAQRHPVRRVLLTDNGTGVTAAVAGSDPHDVGFVSAPVPGPALGSPGEDLRFVAAPDGGVGVLAWDRAPGGYAITGFRCDAAYTCAAPWFDLPKPAGGWSHQLLGAWRANRGEAPTYVAAATGEHYASVSLWRVGRDGVTPLPAAEKLLRARGVNLSGGAENVVLSFDAAGRVVMRALSFGDARGARHDVVYASHDEGRTWQPVVLSATDHRDRVSGPPGWRPGAVSQSFVPALVTRPDVWLANVSDGHRYRLLCSRDRGRSWHGSCS